MNNADDAGQTLQQCGSEGLVSCFIAGRVAMVIRSVKVTSRPRACGGIIKWELVAPEQHQCFRLALIPVFRSRLDATVQGTGLRGPQAPVPLARGITDPGAAGQDATIRVLGSRELPWV